MNVEEAFRYLEELEAEDSESTDVISASICITPPINEPGDRSDEDSADEDDVFVHNLGSRQMRAEASIVIEGRNDTGRVSEDEDEESPTESCHPKWVKGDLNKRTAMRNFPWNLPTPALDSNDSPCTLFEKIFTAELLNYICDETNKYAAANGKDSFKLETSELKVFLAILLASGYVKFPRKRMFWETSEDVSIEGISAAMSRNRFEEILRYLHLADNSTLDASDKFSKVCPLINAINKQCKSNFITEQHISIDESMVPYHGRHGAKQYLHGKPIKFGYKVWVAATRLGYVVAFDPYQGKGSIARATETNYLGLGGSVVCQLVKELPNNETLHYHIVFDNFFTSPKLLSHLQGMGIAATGTLRANRDGKAPLKAIKEMEKQPRGTHDSVVDKTSNVCLTRWKDNKVVTVASTFTGSNPVGSTRRFVRAERERKTIPIPKSVQTYNKMMGVSIVLIKMWPTT